GLIERLTDWMFEHICEEVKLWQASEVLSTIPVSVNISSKLFREHYILHKIEEMIKEGKIFPEKLILEIKEELLLNYPQDTYKTLSQLKELGLGVSLDDFGTGFSSITYLKKFPIDIIKINQVFMQDVLSNKENIEMAKAIIS